MVHYHLCRLFLVGASKVFPQCIDKTRLQTPQNGHEVTLQEIERLKQPRSYRIFLVDLVVVFQQVDEGPKHIDIDTDVEDDKHNVTTHYQPSNFGC